MSEIEKMRRYIERTKMNETDRFYLDFSKAMELARKTQDYGADAINIIDLVFKYGKAKGYRAAKAEVRK